MEELVCSNQDSDTFHTLHLADVFLKSLLIYRSCLPFLLFAYFNNNYKATSFIYPWKRSSYLHMLLSPIGWVLSGQYEVIRGLMMNTT